MFTDQVLISFYGGNGSGEGTVANQLFTLALSVAAACDSHMEVRGNPDLVMEPTSHLGCGKSMTGEKEHDMCRSQRFALSAEYSTRSSLLDLELDNYFQVTDPTDDYQNVSTVLPPAIGIPVLEGCQA